LDLRPTLQIRIGRRRKNTIQNKEYIYIILPYLFVQFVHLNLGTKFTEKFGFKIDIQMKGKRKEKGKELTLVGFTTFRPIRWNHRAAHSTFLGAAACLLSVSWCPRLNILQPCTHRVVDLTAMWARYGLPHGPKTFHWIVGPHCQVLLLSAGRSQQTVRAAHSPRTDSFPQLGATPGTFFQLSPGTIISRWCATTCLSSRCQCRAATTCRDSPANLVESASL
jgi:hypothetical protein